MSDERGGTGVSGTPPSRRTVLGVVALVAVLVIVVVLAVFQGGPSSNKPVADTPTLGDATIAPSGAAGPSAASVPSAAGLAPGRTLSGVAGVGTSAAAAFGDWRGKPVDVVDDYTGTNTWDGVTQLDREGLLDRGLPAHVHRVFSVPLIPTAANATLAAGAAGDYDQHFRDLAEELVHGHLGNATIRLGWEMTGDWFAWSGVPDPQDWALAFQKAVTAMRSVPGAAFSFDWTVALGNADPEPMYPGDNYVDLIGADVYDASYASYPATDHVQAWNGYLTENWGLNWLAGFASKHGKRISIGEWGVTQRCDGHGGGDDPYFIQQMHDWISAHDVAYEAYFNSTDPSVCATFALDSGKFPQAGAAYQQLFGGGSTSSVGSAQPSQ